MGVDKHQVCDVPIAKVGAHAHSNEGPVMCMFNKVAHTGRHQSILSPIHMEEHGVKVDEKHPTIGDLGQLQSPDGFIFPLSSNNALPHLKIRPYADKEFDSLLHVVMTSDEPWDPRSFNNDHAVDPNQFSPHPQNCLPDPNYDLTGEHMGTKAQ